MSRKKLLERYAQTVTMNDWQDFDQMPEDPYDWRTYVSQEVRDAWPTLSVLSRCAVISCCIKAVDTNHRIYNM